MKLSEVEKNVIILLHQDGFSQRAIARMTEHHRKTVKKYIEIYEHNKWVSTINLIGFWMITIGIVFLAVYGLYMIIN